MKLLETIDLEENWDVGLYSISYPNTWYTLQKGFDTHVYYADQNGLFLRAIVDYGYYTSSLLFSNRYRSCLVLEGTAL